MVHKNTILGEDNVHTIVIRSVHIYGMTCTSGRHSTPLNLRVDRQMPAHLPRIAGGHSDSTHYLTRRTAQKRFRQFLRKFGTVSRRGIASTWPILGQNG